MTTYSNALVVYEDGRLQKVQGGDSLSVSGSVAIGGNLDVTGTITSGSFVNSLSQDAFIDLNSGYLSNVAAYPSGLTSNIKVATGFSALTVSDFVAGVVATSAPKFTVSVGLASTLAAGDIIQVSNASEAENNGLFIVASVVGSDVEVYGVGGTAVPGYALFAQSQFVAATGAAATVVKVDLSVITVSDGVSIKDEFGVAVPVGRVAYAYYPAATLTNFNGTVTGTGYMELAGVRGSITLQSAYDASSSPATITLANGKNFVVDAPTSGSAGFSLNALGTGGTLRVEDSTLTLDSVRTSTGGAINMTAGGAMTISSALGNMTISTSAAKILATADYNSASTGEFRIRSANSGAGGAEFTAKAKTYVRIGAGSVTEPLYDLVLDSPNKAINLQAAENTSFINIGTSAFDTTVQLGYYLVKLLSQMQLLNASSATLTALPTFEGALAYDSDLNQPVWNDGTSWQTFGSLSASTLQQAYEGGNTIVLSSAEGDLAISNGVGSAAVTIDTNKNSYFTVTGANLTLSTATSGDVEIASAGSLTANSATGSPINIGTDVATTVMSIGTGGVRNITLGNISGVSSLNLRSGTSGTSLSSTGTVDINTTGSILIGNLLDNGAISIGIGGSRAINIGNVDPGTGVNISGGLGGGGVNIDTSGSVISLDAVGAQGNFTVNGANLTLSTVTSGTVAVTSAGSMDIDAVDGIQINSSAGVIDIGNDPDAQNINIGTGAAARLITVGNATGATQLDFNAGTGGITLDTTAGGAISLDANGAASNFTVTGGNLTLSTATSGALNVSSAGVMQLTADDFLSINTTTQAIFIGNTGATTQMDFGTGGTRFISVGNTNGITSVAVAAGTGGLTLDATGVVEINSSGAAISIGNDADAQAINVGTGAAARTITIGNATGATAVDINTGTGGIDIAAGGSSTFYVTNGSLGINTITSGSITLNSAGAGSFTAAGTIALTSTGATATVSSIGVASLTSTADDAVVTGDTGVRLTGGSGTIRVGTPTVPMVFGTTSASQAAGGTWLPVGASSGIGIGEVLYLNTSGELAKADGDGTGTREVIGVSLDVAGAGAGDLLVGTVLGSVIPVKFASAPAGSDVGKPVYLSTTAGLATSTAPVSGRVYRLGLLLSATANGAGNYRVLWQPNLVADL